ncbi:MAG TPA: HEAT repeat domain-containing protein, partial [Opitutaceae bacterium]|nr:HEAT repeat domain-containing protein [Opitutaceae bacterium]
MISAFRFLPKIRLWLLPVVGLALITPARAYIDLAPTIVKVMGDSQKISVVEVAEFNPATHILVLKEIRALKGELGTASIRHDVASADGVIPSNVARWADVGARGVLFSSRTTALVCLGEGWYQAKLSGGEWKLGIDRPDLTLAYYGTVSRLADGIVTMLAGGEAILTTVQHGTDEAASFDLALNRTNLPGLIRVQRIRANMKMPAMVMAMSGSSAYVLGMGRVGEEELPGLIQKLASADAATRAEAAEELQLLGRKARSAETALVKLLADPAVRVRISAASALLSISGKNDAAVKVLSETLASPDAAVRRAAAIAVGRAGPGAVPLAGNLATLLKDKEAAVQSAAIQAVATLGPLAAEAAKALVPLLNDPKLFIDAAD